MKLQTTTQDFIPKLKSFIRGYINLREAGIPNVKVDLDPLLNDFLFQFEETAPEPTKVPLPPTEITGKPVYAYIARHKTSRVSMHKTLSTGQWACALALQDAVPSYDRHNYEIVALCAND